jgi:hypothetical protein
MSGTITPASHPFDSGFAKPPWQPPQSWVMTALLPRITSPGDGARAASPRTFELAGDPVHPAITATSDKPDTSNPAERNDLRATSFISDLLVG